MKFSIKDFFRKCDQIRSFLPIWSHFLKISLMENSIFLCSVVLMGTFLNVKTDRNVDKVSYKIFHFKSAGFAFIVISNFFRPNALYVW